MGKAIGYFRVSEVGAPAGTGGDPEQNIRHWCTSHQHQVAEVHSDQGGDSSGLDHALKSAVDAAILVVDTVQSLTSGGGSPEQVYKRLQAAGTRLVAIQEQIEGSADSAAVRAALGLSAGAGPDVRITFSAGDTGGDAAAGSISLPEMEGDEVADEYAVPSLSLDEELSPEEMAELAPAPTFGDEQEAGVVPAEDDESVGVWSLDDDDDEEDEDIEDGPEVSVASDQTDIDALLESKQDSVARAAEAGAKPAEQTDIDFLMAMHAGGGSPPKTEETSEPPAAAPEPPAAAPEPQAAAPEPQAAAPEPQAAAAEPQAAAPEPQAAAAEPQAAAGTGVPNNTNEDSSTFPPTFSDDGKTTVPTPAQQTDVDFLVAMHGARRAVPGSAHAAPPAEPAPAPEAAPEGDSGYTLPQSSSTPLGVAPADAPPLGNTPLEGDPAQEAAQTASEDFVVPPSAAPPLGSVASDPGATSSQQAASGGEERVIYPIDDDYGYSVPPRRPQTDAPEESAPEATSPEPQAEEIMDLGADNPFEDLAREMAGEATMQVARELAGGTGVELSAKSGEVDESPEDPARGMQVPPPPPGVPLSSAGKSKPASDLGTLREAPKSYSPLAPITGPEGESDNAVPPAADMMIPQSPQVLDVPPPPQAPVEASPQSPTGSEEPVPMADFLEQGGMVEPPPADMAPPASAEGAMEMDLGQPLEAGAANPEEGVSLKPVQGGAGHMVHGELEEQAPKTITPVGMFGKAVRDDDADSVPDEDPLKLSPLQSGAGHMVHGELEDQAPKTITPVGGFAKAVRDDDATEEPLAPVSEDEVPAGLMSDEPAGPPQPIGAPAASGDDPGLDVAGAIARARAEVQGPGVGTSGGNQAFGATAVQAPPATMLRSDTDSAGAPVMGGPQAWDRRARVGGIPASITGAGVVDLSQAEEAAVLSRLRRHSDYIPVAEAASREVAQGHFSKAMELWQNFLPSAEGHNRGMAMNAIGDVYVRLGKTESATENFEQAVKAFEETGYYTKAVAALKKVRKLAPDKTGANLRLGELAARCGRLGDAVEAFLIYARDMVGKGDVFAARGIFDRIRILDPVNARHRLQLAVELREFGFLEEAVTETVNAADILMAQGRQEEAQRHLDTMAQVAGGNEQLRKALDRVAAGEKMPEPEPPVEGGLGGPIGDLDGDDGSFWHRPLESDTGC